MQLSALLDRLPPRIAVPARARFGHRDLEVGELHRWVRPGSTVWDVGAHKGSYTWHLARLVGPGGRVHAFEPQPDLAARLAQGVPAQVTVHGVALSAEHGTAPLTVPVWGRTRMQGHASLEGHNATGPDQTVDVPTRTADSFHHCPTFVKIDVEGHERTALRGAEETITRARPVLLVEIDFRHPHGATGRAELLEWMTAHGYRAHHVPSPGELVASPDLRGGSDPNEGIVADHYVFNWVFLPG
ncbi:MAG: FkbM family methyltransferase [Mycobacteriaceae bacterium]